MKLLFILGLCVSVEAMDNSLKEYKELNEKHNNLTSYTYQLKLKFQELIKNPLTAKDLDLEGLDKEIFDASQMWHVDNIEKLEEALQEQEERNRKLISENLELKEHIKTLCEKPATQSKKTQVQNVEAIR